MNRNDPWLQKNVSWVRQEAVVKGHFTFIWRITDRSCRNPLDSELLIARKGIFYLQQKGQPKGRPTRVSYHIPLAASSGFVSLLCKSVFYTKTFCVFYTLLHLEFLNLLWYLIDTKRWYQCTGKTSDFKEFKIKIEWFEIVTIPFEEKKHTARVRKT